MSWWSAPASIDAIWQAKVSEHARHDWRSSIDIQLERAAEAPIVRRLFSSSPKDPRYHMLSHLSAKFRKDNDDQNHEPRAALFLNRFTRTLTVMYATSGIEEVIGISGEDMKGRSFYYCIAQNCLEDAVKCVETAKGNDSIAYLRFRFRDPRVDDPSNQTTSDEETDASMTDVTASEDEDEVGGAMLDTTSSSEAHPSTSSARSNTQSSPTNGTDNMDFETSTVTRPDNPSRNSSGNSIPQADDAIFEDALATSNPSSSAPTSPDIQGSPADHAIELEAVVSCTSDGLVVILRRARPIIPSARPDGASAQAQDYPRGFFAAPWGRDPVYIPVQTQPYPGWIAGMNPYPGQPPIAADSGPAKDYFMNSIREVAVFAWALTGINGCLADYTRGTPSGESQPPGGFPVWAPQGHDSDSGISQTSHSTRGPFGDPGLGHYPTTGDAHR
jgi:hypothetical protein